MSMESTNVDISHLSVEQLRELLKLKENSVSTSNTTPTISTLSTPTTSDTEKVKPCSFIPKKANQQPCTELPNVNYGDRGFCKKHARTVQAINAKNSFVESQKPVEILHPVSTESTRVDVEEKAPEKIPEKTSGEKIEKVLKTTSKSLKNDQSKKTPKIKSPTPNVVKRKISQNKWGRYEDEETSILFDPKTKAAYGIQDRKSGKVLPLNEKAIAICEKYKWKYFAAEAESEEESSETVSEEVSKPQILSQILSQPKKDILKKKVPTPESSEESSVEMPTPKKGILKKKVPTPEPSEEESSEPLENENLSEEEEESSSDDNVDEDSSLVEDISESLENNSESVSESDEKTSEEVSDSDQKNTEEASDSDEKITDDEE
jgi:hypothetical protein